MTKKPTKKRSKTKSRIPDFKSYEEEASWWDSHSLADLQDEFKTVDARFAKNLSETMNIRFDPLTLNRLRGIAYKVGIGPTTLARMWILEKLQTIGEKATPRPHK